MIGNDIIDLTQVKPFARSTDERFLHKILTESERAALQESPFPDLQVWAYWALKESTYKAAFRQNPQPRFAPKELMVDFLAPLTLHEATPALVRTATGTWQGRAFVLESVIHAQVIPTNNAFSDFFTQEFRLFSTIPAEQSKAVHNHAKTAFAMVFNLTKPVELEKEGSVPFIRRGAGRYPITLSHHGYWGAVMFYLDSTILE